jgi:HEAT repeat protein
VTGLVDQFKAAEGSARTAAQLDAACTAIVTAALPALESDEPGLHQVGRTTTLEFAFYVSRPGAEPERLALSKALAAKVAAAKVPAKVWICRLFQHMGRDECVAALTALLSDADAEVQESARRALLKNSSAAAGAALVAALAKADAPAWRMALVNAVADRADPTTTVAIAKYLADKDLGVAMAAAYGLGNIGGTEAVNALTAAKASAADKVKDAVLDGLLLAAADLVRKGSVDEAAAVYRDLDVPASPPRIRMGALRGAIITGGEKAVPTLTAALTGTDPAMRNFALSLLPEVRGAAGTKALVELMPKLAPAEQAVVLNELAARNDAAVKPALLEALKSSDASVRSAAVAALGPAGDESALPALVEMIVKAPTDADRKSVEKTAASICARSANKEACAAAILKELPKAQGAGRLSLLALLGQTGTKSALAAVVPALKDADPEVQAVAVKTLGEWPNTAPAADLLAYVKAEASSARQVQALRGFVRLASLGEMPAADRTQMYADALAAAKRPEDKTMVLSEMGNFPSAAALGVIRPLLAGDSKNEAAAAIIKIAAAVAAGSPAEAKAALQQTIDSGANDNLKAQARQTLATVENLPSPRAGGSPR